jgi:aerobic-type carbon monoxide dehydrogenase small subunit (CoxS/CutS family)
MAKFNLIVNGSSREVDADPKTKLLWVLRDNLNLTGTKFGCGIAECGACTVHIDGEPMRSCQKTLEFAVGKKITTIEGLSRDRSHPLQKAWIDLEVPQCGYCQSGMLMTAAALLAKTPQPTDAQIDEVLGEHVCRCGTYQRIRAAVHQAAGNGGAK